MNNGNLSNKEVIITATTLVILAIIGSIFFLKYSEISAARAIATAEIEAKKEIVSTELHEKADVEQTEERSQFWQKLVPWGQDEEESDDALEVAPTAPIVEPNTAQ